MIENIFCAASYFLSSVFIQAPKKFQFTLYCELKGNKPDYRHAMTGESAQQFYNDFLTSLRMQYKSEMIKGKKTVFLNSAQKVLRYSNQPYLSRSFATPPFFSFFM